MKDFISDRVRNVTVSGIRAIAEKVIRMEQEGRRIIHFEVGRPDFDTPEYIKKAACDALNAGDVFYTGNMGKPELRREIAKKLLRENGLSYVEDEILVTAGLSEAVFDILTSVLNEGDEILVPDPVWVGYRNIPGLCGAKVVTYTLYEETQYQPDVDEIRDKITDKTKAIVLITPNNPTGSILHEETLRKIAKLAMEKDILVISDEIYERLIYDGEKHFSIASIPGMKERTLTLNGMSKTFSMTGWRLGYIAGPKEIIAMINRVHQYSMVCAPSFVQTAGIAALRDEKDEVQAMVDEYKRRRDYAVAAINATPGISCVMPKGAFYIFINCTKLGKSGYEIVEYLLEKEGIALVPGEAFGEVGKGYVRMSYANSYENIVEGCRRLAEGVKAMQEEKA